MARQAAADINKLMAGSCVCSMDKRKCAKATVLSDQHADNVMPSQQGLTASALMTSLFPQRDCCCSGGYN